LSVRLSTRAERSGWAAHWTSRLLRSAARPEFVARVLRACTSPDLLHRRVRAMADPQAELSASSASTMGPGIGAPGVGRSARTLSWATPSISGPTGRADTLTAWLEEPPGIEGIARGRSDAYAKATGTLASVPPPAPTRKRGESEPGQPTRAEQAERFRTRYSHPQFGTQCRVKKNFVAVNDVLSGKSRDTTSDQVTPDLPDRGQTKFSLGFRSTGVDGAGFINHVQSFSSTRRRASSSPRSLT